jgi:hypothetical protein
VTLSYPDALAYLYPRVTQIKFGLDTTRALLAELGDPHRVMPIVHVGGTNGKGSVTALVAAALGAAGWRVGTYTSPHLISFRAGHGGRNPHRQEAAAMGGGGCDLSDAWGPRSSRRRRRGVHDLARKMRSP